jgi:hypothetical protein
MEDGVAIARCLRRAGKGNSVEGLKVYERIRYLPPSPFHHFWSHTVSRESILTAGTIEYAEYKKWEKALETNGTKRTGMP